MQRVIRGDEYPTVATDQREKNGHMPIPDPDDPVVQGIGWFFFPYHVFRKLAVGDPTRAWNDSGPSRKELFRE